MMNTTQYQWAQMQRSGSRVNRKRFGLLPSRVVVDELHHAVRFRDGVIVDVLRPGVHWLRPRSEQFATLSALPQTLTVKSQEILTSDGITVRATVATIVRIVDPIVALRAGDWQSQLYLCVQLALRSEVTSRDLETLVGERDGVDGPLLEATRNVGQQLGVEVTQLAVRDLVVPGEQRRLLSQVVDARLAGQASLEQARAETAAMRSLANAASLMKDNPELYQLRLLQEMAKNQGNTFVVGADPAALPIAT